MKHRVRPSLPWAFCHAKFRAFTPSPLFGFDGSCICAFISDESGQISWEHLWNMSSSIDIFWFHAVHACAFAYANYYARLCQCFKCQNRADDDGNDGSRADAALFIPFYDILCLLNWRLPRWQTLIQWGACPVLPGQGCKFPASCHWKIWSWWVRPTRCSLQDRCRWMLVLSASAECYHRCLRPNGSEGQVAALCRQKCPKFLTHWHIISLQLFFALKSHWKFIANIRWHTIW